MCGGSPAIFIAIWLLVVQKSIWLMCGERVQLLCHTHTHELSLPLESKWEPAISPHPPPRISAKAGDSSPTPLCFPSKGNPGLSPAPLEISLPTLEQDALFSWMSALGKKQQSKGSRRWLSNWLKAALRAGNLLGCDSAPLCWGNYCLK